MIHIAAPKTVFLEGGGGPPRLVCWSCQIYHKLRKRAAVLLRRNATSPGFGVFLLAPSAGSNSNSNNDTNTIWGGAALSRRIGSSTASKQVAVLIRCFEKHPCVNVHTQVRAKEQTSENYHTFKSSSCSLCLFMN